MSLEVVYSRILLVRHGHYERVGDQGDTVWGLTALGRRQAARTGRRLVQLIEAAQGKFEGLFSSPWPRALQTAEIISAPPAAPRVPARQRPAEPEPEPDEPGRLQSAGIIRR